MVRLKNKTFVVVIKGPYRAVARGPFNDEKPQQGDHAMILLFACN